MNYKCDPHTEGTVATYNTTCTSTAEQMLRTKMANTIVLFEEVLVAENGIDKATIGRIKELGLNLVAIPRDTLYQL